ncbi:MAG: hypothetical protein GX597_23625 [Anaerolineaceae bacterium]|nr:hypothetical protein [Anaerolineaceae bacterium]
MAKKSRRAYKAPSAPQRVQISRPARPLATATEAKDVNFKEEYHYVLEDLRRIAIIAAALLVLLVVLALVIA